MKFNQDKVKEALRIREELYKECEALSNGIKIARNVFPSRGIFSWILQGKYNTLFEAREICRRTQAAVCAIDIDKRHNEYSIWYDGMQIHSLEEYLRCRREFKKEYFLFKGEEYWKVSGKDYRRSFSEQVTEFLDKLEEAFKD